MNNIKSYSQFTREINESHSIIDLIELSIFSEIDPNLLKEDIGELEEAINIKGALEKAGLHAKKGRGLIQILSSAGKHISKIFWYAIKAHTGDEKAKEELKTLLKKKVSKEDIIDVLLKLDQLTLHAITGPIHAIEAATGWHIAANIKKVSKTVDNVKDRFENAIKSLNDLMKDTNKKTSQRISKTIDFLTKLFTPNTSEAVV